ncbi:hypothetical protein [Streptomyces sp. HB2AG]|uniref:hypothetical protein n=1 Tax=Streptomyces sp. HB2AG TaxID=2983400 RepID=UPI0022AACFDE|nr:hypothetical protein [Streptomyces sp. HB2AG]MCZ2526995.1 hypothetical protein [Streptomyces sp. HB2AG]
MNDAEYLHTGGRIPNADYHFGFAVECALKSLLLRFLGAKLDPKKPGGKPSLKPWVLDSGTNKPREYGHLPWLEADIALLAHGRAGARFLALLDKLDAFSTWSVSGRYRDGADVDEKAVADRREAARDIMDLHMQALQNGRL